MAHLILVERFLEYYDPFDVLELDRAATEADLFRVDVQKIFGTATGGIEWDIGRIRYFWEELDRGRTLDPVAVKGWEESRGHLFGNPVLVDGHHRLCAANLFGLERIPAEWLAGPLEVLSWLKGRRKTDPLKKVPRSSPV